MAITTDSGRGNTVMVIFEGLRRKVCLLIDIKLRFNWHSILPPGECIGVRVSYFSIPSRAPGSNRPAPQAMLLCALGDRIWRQPKLVDMYFWQIGFDRGRRQAARLKNNSSIS